MQLLFLFVLFKKMWRILDYFGVFYTFVVQIWCK